MSVEIKVINPTRKELEKFVEFEINLYRNNPYHVPPLIKDDVDTLDPNFNPAFDFCESRYFMAFRDGKAVGRIAAIINKRGNALRIRGLHRRC